LSTAQKPEPPADQHTSPLFGPPSYFSAMTDTGGHPLSTSDELAVERTRLSHDRTLMANVRTSTALISFGFTIYKFFAEMEERGELKVVNHPLGARNFALVMMMIGVVFVVLASLAYVQQMKRMHARYGISIERLPLSLAGVISLLGVLGLLSVLLRQ
jgi:inner membrane protein YidH